MRRVSVPLIFAIAFAVYIPALYAGFVWDDVFQVQQNPWIKDPRLLGNAFARDLAGFLPGYETNYYRPLIHVFHASIFAVFGAEPWAFHLASVLLHAGASVCLFLLLSRWTSSVIPPLLASLLFAVHPIHTEPVIWVTGVIEVAYSLLVLVALLAVTAQRHRWWLVIPPIFAMALLWKEPAIVLFPIVVVLLGIRGDFKNHRRASMALVIAMSAVVLGYFALRINALGGVTAQSQNTIRLGVIDWATTSVALVGEYARYLVLPLKLSAIHDYPIVNTPLDFRFVCGALTVSAVCVAAWRARRTPELFLGIMLVALPLLPALYIPALKDSLIAERYLYLPSAGAAILLAYCLRRWPQPLATFAGRAIVAVVLLSAVAGTLARGGTWRSDLSLWTDALEKAPQSAVAHEYAGAALVIAQRYAEAVPILTRALELNPKRVDARTNLSIALASTGRTEDAIVQAEIAIRQRPLQVEAYTALGWALAEQGRFSEAVTAYEKALQLAPSSASVHNLAGIAYAQLGRLDVAVFHFEAAVRLEPANGDYARNLQLLHRLDPSLGGH